MSYILDKIDRSNVLVASHNQNSIEFTVDEVRGVRGVREGGEGTRERSDTATTLFEFP